MARWVAITRWITAQAYGTLATIQLPSVLPPEIQPVELLEFPDDPACAPLKNAVRLGCILAVADTRERSTPRRGLPRAGRNHARQGPPNSRRAAALGLADLPIARITALLCSCAKSLLRCNLLQLVGNPPMLKASLITDELEGRPTRSAAER